MHPERHSRLSARLACLAAVAAMYFAAPAMYASDGTRAGSGCQAGGQTEHKSLAFVVTRVERRPGGEFILTFENGEVWQQTDRSKKLDIERGEQIVIRKSKTGVFTLVSRSGLSTRVKRVH